MRFVASGQSATVSSGEPDLRFSFKIRGKASDGQFEGGSRMNEIAAWTSFDKLLPLA
jgi:hypothetical protein